MNILSGIIGRDKEFTDFLGAMGGALDAPDLPPPIVVNGLSGGAELLFLAEAVREARRKSDGCVLVLASTDAARDRVVLSLQDFGIQSLALKERDFVFYNIGASHDTERERLSVLHSLLFAEVDCIVATPKAALSLTMPPEVLSETCLSMSLGDEIAPEEVVKRLLRLGFAAVDMVDGKGQFSRRGGIIDLWGAPDEAPVRIEFFGDEVDRISAFDAITQRTVSNLKEIKLLPAREILIDEKKRAELEKFIEGLLKKADNEMAKTRLSGELATIKAGGVLNFADKYLGLIYDRPYTLFDYLSGKRRVAFVLGTEECRSAGEKYTKALSDTVNALINEGLTTLGACVLTATKKEQERFYSENLTVHVNSFAGGVRATKLSGLFGFRCRRTVAYGNTPKLLCEDIETYARGGYSVLVLSPTENGRASVSETLDAAGIAHTKLKENEVFAAKGAGVYLGVGTGEGLDLIIPKIAVLSTEEEEGRKIMARRRQRRILKEAGGAGQRLVSYADLSKGDYVVHLNYGIGLFEGIETVTVDGVTKDYITIRYAGTDKLFVPCDRLELIGKYIGSRDKSGGVKLSKMGGGDWARTKTHAKNAARDIAKELIAIYAERQRRPGFAFPQDSELEDSFAMDFGFEETDSQLSAIEDIKKDMMRPVPMNRLLLGDVGFGKTEVALRAAFKAVMGGKQVAILVPTTVLALQHFETATSRMRNYPVTVEMLSRFRTPKEQKRIMERLLRGEIDILIGTHRLLSKELKFRDLGLLIIDEEQRFGVAQKEKLKNAVRNVDLLTLSATPIPRTLNMAMNSISDMSLLDEAPGERKPVQTYVFEYDDAIIYDAIEKELARDGQVFYLYNEVGTIGFVADRLAAAFPKARVAVAHGQMEREEIEDIWRALVDAEVDILVCTTIIETGIDLPSANTLIIENADRFGLSQLHQIRGRVGRSARQAYAYFTYRPGKALSEEATKRLSAIREFAEFGAGFKVALRDLEIRGAGNLLGAEQHGYIDSVGYDLYVKLLNEAVLEEKGEKAPDMPETLIDIKVNAYIPEGYLKNGAQRMEMYKKISLIRDKADYDDILDEFVDRFGDVPKCVERLLGVALSKAIATRAGFSKVEFKDGRLSIFLPKPRLDIWSVVLANDSAMSIRASGTATAVTKKLRVGDDAVFELVKILTEYARAEGENDE